MKNIIPFTLIIFALVSSSCIKKNEPHKKETKNISLQKNAAGNIPEMKEIVFVGMNDGKESLYKYNFITNLSTEFLQMNEKIIELSYSPDKKSIFLLTAKKIGKKGVFPFVDGVKLYTLAVDSGKTNFIENIGNGLQVFSYWETDNSFKVLLNVIDVAVAKYVDQITRTYDKTGKKLLDEKKTYELAKQGYPLFPQLNKNLISPDKKYSINSFDSAQTQIYLIDHEKNDANILIAKLNQKLNYVNWSKDGKFLLVSTIDVSPGNETLYDAEPKTSTLFVYSLTDKKIVQQFEGGGVKDFVVNGDILFFDIEFGEKSKIFLYNFRSNKLIDSIKIGGSGLKNISSIPDYGA